MNVHRYLIGGLAALVMVGIAYAQGMTGISGLYDSTPPACADGYQCQILSSSQGKLVTQPHALPGNTWKATGDQDNSTDTTIVAASSGNRHCVTSAQIYAFDTLGADHVFRILSNDTVIFQRPLSAEGMVGSDAASDIVFPIPLCTTAGEALEVDAAGDPTDNLIYYNLQGYTAP
jgi:hypothetical protein